jgi:hypothetical protein
MDAELERSQRCWRGSWRCSVKHRIQIDRVERDLDIRAMDASFVVYRKMYAPPLTPANIGKVNPGDPPGLARYLNSDGPKVIEAFLLKQIRAIDSCAILVWDRGGVIGKMYFTTKELFAEVRPAAKRLGLDHDEFPGCMCIENPDMRRVVESFREDQLASLLASPSRTLRILCLNVGHFDTRYHGQGIASAMLEFLKVWASDRGWRALEAISCADVVPFRAVGPHILRRSYLEKRGFRVVEEKPARSDDLQRRVGAIKRILSGSLDQDDWDVKSYARNVALVRRLASDPSWREVYDRTYTMACDLASPPHSIPAVIVRRATDAS